MSEPTSAQQFHSELSETLYKLASEHKITGYEAAGVLFLLATEVSASALVRDGLLEGGPDFAESQEEDDEG